MKSFLLNKKYTAFAVGSLLAVSSASANLSFVIDEFTSDVLTITISGVSELAGTAPVNDFALFLADTGGTSSFFSSTGIVAVLTPDGAATTLGAADLSGNVETIDSLPTGGTVAIIPFDMSLTSGMSFGSDTTLSFAGAGLFDPGAITGELGLYWGTGVAPDLNPSAGVLQDSVAVPELSSSSLVLGLFALGACSVFSRRRA
ncbi:MAG TPA: hypothetical protein DEA90_00490 [Opitutae bacterium]|nr:hypothetical protein [Puniceicoccaceae bacterium]HBR92624.1 hypothetical protein [Opitutae bacterium]|tara:strand:- start:205 stop:810 length:606 start_codon:yes stop_codon:yes gene_type:complete